MKSINEPMEHRFIKSKMKKRKPTLQRLTQKQLEEIQIAVFIKTFSGEKYLYLWDRLSANGIPNAVDLNTLQPIALKDIYYDIRHVRIADTTSEKHQIIARRKQADADLLVMKGMRHYVMVPQH